MLDFSISLCLCLSPFVCTLFWVGKTLLFLQPKLQMSRKTFSASLLLLDICILNVICPINENIIYFSIQDIIWFSVVPVLFLNWTLSFQFLNAFAMAFLRSLLSCWVFPRLRQQNKNVWYVRLQWLMVDFFPHSKRRKPNDLGLVRRRSVGRIFPISHFLNIFQIQWQSLFGLLLSFTHQTEIKVIMNSFFHRFVTLIRLKPFSNFV